MIRMKAKDLPESILKDVVAAYFLHVGNDVYLRVIGVQQGQSVIAVKTIRRGPSSVMQDDVYIEHNHFYFDQDIDLKVYSVPYHQIQPN